MRRRITNAENKELLILSRSQKCCRFKIEKATRPQKKSLSNLNNKIKRKNSKESNRECVALTVRPDVDMSLDS